MNHTATKNEAVKKLKKYLNAALFISPDRQFALKIIRKIEHAPWDRKTKDAAHILESFVKQDEDTQTKIKQRFSTQSIDIVSKVFKGFSKNEIKTILLECHDIQLTDGCTVGCPWCCFASNPILKSKISFISFEELLKQYAHHMQNDIMFYYASDPFDWIDGNRSYIDFAKLYDTYGKSFKTSTAIPLGTEISIIRFLCWIYKEKNIPVTQTDTYIDVGLIEQQLYERVQQKKKINSSDYLDYFIYLKNKKSDGVKNSFRISKTKKNEARLKNIITLLRFLNFDNSQLTDILIENRDTGNSQSLVNMGRYINNPTRDPVVDAIGTACYDGVLITPSTIEALQVTAVTKNTPEGLYRKTVLPGFKKIPKSLYIFDYMYKFSDADTNLKPLLPYSTVYTCKNGIIQKKSHVHDLRRDILAYAIMWVKIIPILETYNHFSQRFNKKFVKNFLNQLEKRMKYAEKLLAKENDEETKNTIQYLLSCIRKWIKKPSII